MTQAEYLAAHAMIGGRRASGQADVRALFARHGMAAAHLAELASRGNHYHRGVPKRRTHSPACSTATRLPRRRALARRHRATVTRPNMRRWPTRTARGADLGDMLLPRISTNVAVWPGEPTAIRSRASRPRSAASRRCRPTRSSCPSHGPPFRGIAARVSRLRAHHSERLAELHAALARRDAPMSAEQVIPVLFRRPLDLQAALLRDGRGDRAPQQSVARRTRDAQHRERRRHPLCRVKSWSRFDRPHGIPRCPHPRKPQAAAANAPAGSPAYDPVATRRVARDGRRESAK
jgi:hypothetical protein